MRALVLVALLCGCGNDSRDAPAPPREEPGVHLGVPPPLIHRARREADGLSQVPPSLRARFLADGRRSSPSYTELAARPNEHTEERVAYEGNVGLVRPAGANLWILALRTRRDGERWRDPLYVLSVVEPGLAPGTRARIDGFVVGERTIGHHALPLIVAFHVERLP